MRDSNECNYDKSRKKVVWIFSSGLNLYLNLYLKRGA